MRTSPPASRRGSVPEGALPPTGAKRSQVVTRTVRQAGMKSPQQGRAHGNARASPERVLLGITLLFIFIPLAVEVQHILVVFFMPPLLLLFTYWMLTAPPLRLGRWDVLLLLLGFWALFAGYLVPSATPAKAYPFAAALLLGVYARHRYGKAFDMDFLIRFFQAVILLQLVVALAQGITHSSIGYIPDSIGSTTNQITDYPGALYRVVGTVGYWNTLSGLLLLLLPFLYPGIDDRRVGLRVLLGVCSCLLIAYNVSRFALLLIPVYLSMAWPGMIRRRRLPMLAGALLLLIVSFILLALLLPTFLPLVEQRWDAARVDLGYRLQQWRSAASVIAEHPLLGIGFGTSRVEYAVSYESYFWVDRPHNLLLLLASESGLPALLLFCAAIVIALRRPAVDRASRTLRISIILVLMLSLIYLFPVEFVIWPLFIFLLGTYMGVTDGTIAHDAT